MASGIPRRGDTMTVVEIGRGEYIDTDEVEHEPECVRFEPDQVEAFRGFLLPRLENARDEASREILAGMRSGRSLGDAVSDVLESLSARKTQRLREWLKEASGTRIYAYAHFLGLYRLSYGLVMTTGGPRDRVVATEEIRSYEVENPAPRWEFYDALKELKYAVVEKGPDSPRLLAIFEESPLVEVSNKDEYDEALAVTGLSPEDGSWEKAGLYDFTNTPPTYSGTVEAYERESMRYEAERVLDYLFQGDEWMDACKTLLED